MPEVREDPDLKPTEKETTVGFASDEDRMRVHSDHAAVVRWLLKNPDFEERSRSTTDEVVHSVTGSLSVGALKLSGRRKQTTPSSVLGRIPEDGDSDV